MVLFSCAIVKNQGELGIMNRSKKSQSNPAVLIAIITLVMILYLILIPPDFREEILNDSNSTDGTSYSNYDVTYLDKNPGYWSYHSLKTMDHDLNSFNLMSRTEAKNIMDAKSLKAKSTAFSKEVGSFTFNIQDIRKTENVYIDLKIAALSGNAQLKVNGYVLKDITGNSREYVVGIDKNYLVEGDNHVEVSSERVGFSFWSSNSIDVSSAKVFADLVDDSGLSSSQKIWIAKDELINIDDATFRYYAGCEVSTAGRLDIILNGVVIFTGIPDCKMLNTIEHINPSILKEGDNLIDFKASSGRYLFDNLLFKSQLKDNEYPTYYFTISNSDFKKLQTGLIDVNLTFTFVNDRDYKEVEALLNGNSIGVSTYDRTYTVEVDPIYDLNEGNNVLEIKPKSSLHIVEVKLRGVYD